MQALADFFSGFGSLFAAGVTMWLLVLLAVTLWSLIAERYWYFYFVFPQSQEIALRRWKRYANAERGLASRARRQIVENVFADTHRSVSLIRSLVTVILLLGLTGSVSGLMRVLDASTLGGAMGQQLMARGIAATAVPTIAAGALVLLALFFTRALGDRADAETRLLADRLRRG
jgi:biopolymer transport protein ExbB